MFTHSYLSTLNGLNTLNGLSVDCTGKVLGTTCTGVPDGLLKCIYRHDEQRAGGVTAASYLVRCALPAGTSVTVMSYTGSLVALTGERAPRDRSRRGPALRSASTRYAPSVTVRL
jgi:hypothetical protein